MSDVGTQVREILTAHGRLPVDVAGLRDSDDLYRAGLTSHACVAIMLACEDEFDIEFTDDYVARATFASIGALEQAVRALGA